MLKKSLLVVGTCAASLGLFLTPAGATASENGNCTGEFFSGIATGGRVGPNVSGIAGRDFATAISSGAKFRDCPAP